MNKTIAKEYLRKLHNYAKIRRAKSSKLKIRENMMAQKNRVLQYFLKPSYFQINHLGNITKNLLNKPTAMKIEKKWGFWFDYTL